MNRYQSGRRSDAYDVNHFVYSEYFIGHCILLLWREAARSEERMKCWRWKAFDLCYFIVGSSLWHSGSSHSRIRPHLHIFWTFKENSVGLQYNYNIRIVSNNPIRRLSGCVWSITHVRASKLELAASLTEVRTLTRYLKASWVRSIRRLRNIRRFSCIRLLYWQRYVRRRDGSTCQRSSSRAWPSVCV
jgi:hypothetical protein